MCSKDKSRPKGNKERKLYQNMREQENQGGSNGTKEKGREGASAAGLFVTAPGQQPITAKQLFCSSNSHPLPTASSCGGKSLPAAKESQHLKVLDSRSQRHWQETRARLLQICSKKSSTELPALSLGQHRALLSPMQSRSPSNDSRLQHDSGQSSSNLGL